jgi:hypothetical protein
VLGMVVGYGDAISRRLRTVVAQDEDSMWHVAYGLADRVEGKGRWSGRVRSNLVRAGQGRARLPLHPNYRTKLWYGITALGAALLLLMEDNGGSEMGCAGWLEGWMS